VSVPLLPPDQADLVEAVARRVVELLDERERPAARQLVDATGLAEVLGIARSTVYEHADELGAFRMGDGPRAAVRFDPERALAAWTARDRSERSEATDLPPVRASGRRRRRAAGRSDGDLLPVRGPA
jgi:hypothetical protein